MAEPRTITVSEELPPGIEYLLASLREQLVEQLRTAIPDPDDAHWTDVRVKQSTYDDLRAAILDAGLDDLVSPSDGEAAEAILLLDENDGCWRGVSIHNPRGPKVADRETQPDG